MKVLYVGSGAVNLSLAGWLHSGLSQTLFLVRSVNHELIQAQAFQCQLPGDKNFRLYKCKAFSSLVGVEKPDLVVFGVKSYALEEVMNTVAEAFGTDIPVMSVLNGVRHVGLVSSKFSNPIFATIGFNAYRTLPIRAVAVGGTVALSSGNKDSSVLNPLYKILSRKVSTTVVKDPMDAAHTKLVINLGNALLTLVAFHKNRSRQLPELQKLTANVLWEGVTVMKKYGVKEARIPGLPPWILLWLSTILPSFLILPIFEKKMKATAINSMAQDVKNGSNSTELEDINGYFIQLAEKVGVEIPYNKGVYKLLKERLENGFEPMTPKEVQSAIDIN